MRPRWSTAKGASKKEVKLIERDPGLANATLPFLPKLRSILPSGVSR
jgi:hypothetical protein